MVIVMMRLLENYICNDVITLYKVFVEINVVTASLEMLGWECSASLSTRRIFPKCLHISLFAFLTTSLSLFWLQKEENRLSCGVNVHKLEKCIEIWKGRPKYLEIPSRDYSQGFSRCDKMNLFEWVPGILLYWNGTGQNDDDESTAIIMEQRWTVIQVQCAGLVGWYHSKHHHHPDTFVNSSTSSSVIITIPLLLFISFLTLYTCFLAHSLFRN